MEQHVQRQQNKVHVCLEMGSSLLCWNTGRGRKDASWELTLWGTEVSGEGLLCPAEETVTSPDESGRDPRGVLGRAQPYKPCTGHQVFHHDRTHSTWSGRGPGHADEGVRSGLRREEGRPVQPAAGGRHMEGSGDGGRAGF